MQSSTAGRSTHCSQLVPWHSLSMPGLAICMHARAYYKVRHNLAHEEDRV